MNDRERDALLTIALLAAFADGRNDDRERGELRRIAERLGGAGAAGLPALYQEVLLGRRTAEAAAAELAAPELRQLAYELAVCVCDADGAAGEAEGRFLERLRAALGLDPVAARTFAAEAAALASAPLPGGGSSPAAGPAAAAGAPGPRPASVAEAELERWILDAAILNGALELLPQSLATMAIVPLQMRLVYRIGKAHGYELDQGHVKDFLATAGVGLASQYVEQVGRKLVGGLLGKLGGGLLGGLGGAATGAAFSFASTWALGQVARRYYAGGRVLTAEALRAAFQGLLAEGRALQQRHAGAVQERARTIDVGSLASLVRGR